MELNSGDVIATILRGQDRVWAVCSSHTASDPETCVPAFVERPCVTLENTFVNSECVGPPAFKNSVIEKPVLNLAKCWEQEARWPL